MSEKPPVWWAAFNARPLGMPIPPNWFGLAAFGLLGAFLSPGFWLVGAGLEAAYLYWMTQSPRFRKAVEAGALRDDPLDRRYLTLLQPLDRRQQQRQHELEMRAREILGTLKASPLMASHADSLEQLVWLHLRLLAARQAIARVVDTASREAQGLAIQEKQIAARLATASLDPELRRSLEQQQQVIDQRQAAHADAARRYEHVESELQRIDQQVALIREQALLATDEGHIGASLDALAASFNEASRWLGRQRDLIGLLDASEEQRLPRRVLHGEGQPPPPLREGESQ